MQPERTRDVIVFRTGSANPVLVDDAMASQGWVGGQAVTWVDAVDDTFMVTYSDGTYGGFLLWGSNESSDQFTSMTGQQTIYKYGILCTGSWLISTITFEKYTYESRVGGGPLVENVYGVGARLTFSLRGYFTPQDEWTLSGDPRAPNTLYIAYVVKHPSPATRDYLTLQTSI